MERSCSLGLLESWTVCINLMVIFVGLSIHADDIGTSSTGLSGKQRCRRDD